MFLTPIEADAINAQVARVESRTGVQIATAVVGKADTYVELPWKAFALGASVAALSIVLIDWRQPQWATADAALLQVVAILGAGAALALLGVFVPAFGRLFLSTTRGEVEVRQYGEALFLTRELFKTHHRTGLLVLISLFERRIEILADTGFQGRVGEADWHSVVARMTPLLRHARPFHALLEGLVALEALLSAKGFQPPAGDHVDAPTSNELSDRPIEEHGA